MANKIKFKIPLVFVVFLALAILGGLYFNVFSLSQSAFGGSFCNLLSSQPTKEGNFFTFLLSAGDCSNSILGSTGTTSVAKGSFPDEQPATDFVVEGATLKQACVNPITNTNIQLKEIRLVANSPNPCTGREYRESTGIASYGRITLPYELVGFKAITSGGRCYVFHEVSLGSAYELDTSEKYTNYTIQMKVGENTKTVSLTPNNRVVQDGFLKVETVGSFDTPLECPPNSAELVAYLGPNSNTILPRQKIWYNSIKTFQVNSLQTDQDYFANYQDYNRLVQKLIGEEPRYSTRCTVNSQGNLQEATISCDPSSPIAIPVVKVSIDSVTSGIFTPEGKPDIIIVNTRPIEAGSGSTISVQIKNIGNDKDTFEVSTQPKNLNLNVQRISQRIQIEPQQTKTVELIIDGSGFSDTFIVSAFSVNKPENKDEESVKISVYPFCTKPQPSPNHIKEYTEELGCVWVCPNQYNQDLDANCNPITSYDRCIEKNESGSCLKRVTYGDQLHCTAIGEMMTTNNYVDGINKGRETKYIQSQRSGYVYVTAPYCNYFKSFGFSDETFVYIPRSATVEANLRVGTTESTSQPGEELVTPPSSSPSPLQGFDFTYIIVGLIVIVVSIIFVKRRK